MSSYNYNNPLASLTYSQILNLFTNLNQTAPTLNHDPSTNGPAAILWDIENCPIPSDIRPEDVATNIRTAIQLHPSVNGPITTFSAYGDFNAFPRRVREGCQRTGVKLVDVPNGRKDAADKAILLDMFLFVLDNRTPSTIVLITGDVDFAPALHVLGQRGYNVIVVVPSSGVFVNSALCNAGRFVWDWLSIVRGPLSNNPRVGQSLVGYNNGNEEEEILYRGVSQSQSRSVMVSQYRNEYSRSSTTYLPVGNGGESCSSGQLEATMWVVPGDVNGLKGQLVKMLEVAGGCMPLMRVPAEYQRSFSKPLFVQDYGVSKLVDLFKKMGDVIAVVGKGNKRFVCLQSLKPNVVSPSLCLSPPPVVLMRREGKGKDVSLSPSPPVVLLRRENKGKDATTNGGGVTGSVQSLEEFKLELQDILVCYSCQIQMDYFEAIYKRRYKRALDYKRMGVNQLDQLFDKLRDVVTVYEDPATGTKLISAC